MSLLIVLAATPTFGQNVPSDFQVISTAGGLALDAECTTVHITADGQGAYHRFLPGDPMTPLLESNTFTLTTPKIRQLWQVIQANDFFNLEAEYSDDEMSDRTFAELIIRANNNTHTVTTENIAVEGFDNILSAINELTPGDDDLIYDTTEPFIFTSRDICLQLGKRVHAPLRKQAITAAGDLTTEILVLTRVHTLSGDAHPGSMVAYRSTLQEAVNRGFVALSGKGGLFGDEVTISIDNSSHARTNRLSLSLYLEFWGPAASASSAQTVENAIENVWGGKTTTSGETMTVDVVTRTSIGVTSAPGTVGFHQIQLVDLVTSWVRGLGSSFNLNQGVGCGTWRTLGDKLNEEYAHEAGHLFGLPDRYQDYRKEPDGTWKRRHDGKIFTSSSLANEIAPSFPGLTTAQLQAWIESGIRRVTVPVVGSENDLMATLTGSVQQSDIDAIAAQAGLIVEIRPGDVLVNKDGGQQNFVITRSEDVFVPAGASKTLNGLFAACIDPSKSDPSAGVGFDVAPSLPDWRGIEAAEYLQILLGYVDEQEVFCGSDLQTQLAVWRITENLYIEDARIDLFLQEAGIDLAERSLDFPRMTNSNPDNPNTFNVTPPELFLPFIAVSTSNLVSIGETATLTGGVDAPQVEGISTEFSWSLAVPGGSAATLTSDIGETTLFTTDVRGIYRALLEVEVTDPLANTFTRETVASFTVPDARTETFEAGILEPEGPFFWKTSEDTPWIVTEDTPHTGMFSAATADIDDNAITTLAAHFEQLTDGSFSFAYKVSSEDNFDFLVFSIDGDVHGKWSGKIDWNTFSVDLSAGDHTVIWAYEKDPFDSDGADKAWIDDVLFPESTVLTAIERLDDNGPPLTYELSQNYPNPFNPTTTISYTIPKTEPVMLVVYDVLGRTVEILAEGMLNPGHYQVHFDAQDLPSGVYYYELRAGAFRELRTMVLLR